MEDKTRGALQFGVRLQVHTSMLYRRWSHENTDIQQLVVPKLKRTEVIDMHHSIPSAAYLDLSGLWNALKLHSTCPP